MIGQRTVSREPYQNHPAGVQSQEGDIGRSAVKDPDRSEYRSLYLAERQRADSLQSTLQTVDRERSELRKRVRSLRQELKEACAERDAIVASTAYKIANAVVSGANSLAFFARLPKRLESNPDRGPRDPDPAALQGTPADQTAIKATEGAARARKSGAGGHVRIRPDAAASQNARQIRPANSLVVATILDEFSHNSFRDEFVPVSLHPSRWREQFEQARPEAMSSR